MINVLADKYLYNLESHIPDNINLQCYDPAEGLPTDLGTTHALLIRTVNNINSETLPDISSSLTFVGTASAGSDHVDVNYLNEQGITFTNAAGCNARSVAEYIATALLIWSEEKDVNLTKLSVGIIGVGQVGTQVERLLNKLGIPFVRYDPPRANRENNFDSASLDEVLACNVLTFHTPLTRGGNHPTHHWLDAEKLSGRSYELILNTSRGGVIDEEALLRAVTNDTVDDIIIDTWEDEPDFSLATAEKTFLKTPHIAGYSEQAKDRATKIVVQAMLNHFNIPIDNNEGSQNARMVKQDMENFSSLSDLLTTLHPIRKYEAELKKIIADYPDERGKHFNKLRAEYPLRHEFPQTFLPTAYFERFPVLKSLGFSDIPAELR